MAKLWKVIKVIIFLWGAFILGAIVTTFLYVNISERLTTKIVPEEKDEIYEKTSEGVRLTVTHKRGEDAGKILLDLSKAGASLVRNYTLPLKKYSAEWLQVSDSDIIRVNENEYRIILYGSSDEDAEFSHNSVWFLKYQNQVKVVEVVNLAGMRKLNDLDLVILGHKSVGLPYQEDYDHVGFQIPIEVRVNNSVQVTPLLTQTGIGLMKKVFDGEARKRMDKLRASKDKETDPDNAETQELIKDALKEFDEAIQDKNVAY